MSAARVCSVTGFMKQYTVVKPFHCFTLYMRLLKRLLTIHEVTCIDNIHLEFNTDFPVTFTSILTTTSSTGTLPHQSIVPGSTSSFPETISQLILTFQSYTEHANSVFWHHYTPHQQFRMMQAQYTQRITHGCCGIYPANTIITGGSNYGFCAIQQQITACQLLFTRDHTEDKDAIQKYGLAHTVIIKLLKTGKYICKS
jgi:hypothetical protein